MHHNHQPIGHGALEDKADDPGSNVAATSHLAHCSIQDYSYDPCGHRSLQDEDAQQS